MSSIFIVGVIVFSGFVFGEIAEKLRFPKVTGYILAGVCMNPGIWTFIPRDFPTHADIVTNIALGFIAFSIGGTLFFRDLKKLGKSVIFITLFEAEFAFIALVLGFLAIAPFFVNIPGATWCTTFIPLALLIGSLGAPTDPSALLAVEQEYHARGKVTSTMLSVSAFDDVLGIINYSIAVVIAEAFVRHEKFDIANTVFHPFMIIMGSVLLGIVFGVILNVLTKVISRETEGVFITMLFGLLTLCFGLATLIGADELLSVMVMGAVVVNFNDKREKIFKLLERYVDELVFVFFFTLSGMHLDFSVMVSILVLIAFFMVFRAFGKISGSVLGAVVSKASPEVRKYTAGGLMPQGGIVIGLALLIRQNPAFSAMSDIIINVIIATTVIHEFIGPILTKISLRKAGEIQ